MNLVKIAEDLKDLPLQAVQAYMNGSNPEVPPYMAQAEMMRRQKAMEKQKLASGAQGQMPSVKEQLEQAAGLMALQQQRQQQGIQQVAQQAQNQPLPVQGNIPQPERQPEGGVAALDIPEDTFAMAGGGIVGYQEGGTTGDPELDALLDAKRRYQRANADTTAIDQAIQALKDRQQRVPRPSMGPPQASTSGDREIMVSEASRRQVLGERTPATYSGTRLPASEEAQYLAQVNRMNPDQKRFWQAYTARFPDAGRQPAPMRMEAPAPSSPASQGLGAVEPPTAAAPQQAGLPAALPQGSAQQMSTGLLKDVQNMQGPTVDLEAIGQEERQLAQQTGIAGLAAQREAMRKQYEDATKDRGLDTAIAGLAGAARGRGGVAAGYLGAKQAQQAQDRAFAKQMYELEAAPAQASYETQRSMLTEARKRANDWAAAQRKAGLDIKAADVERQTQLELEQLKQGNRMGYLERQGQLFGTKAKAAGEGKLTDVEKAQVRALDSQIKAEQSKLKGFVPAAKRAEIENRIEGLVRQRNELLGMPSEPVESSASTADPLGIR